jgi:Protein of unknown function (DUF3307)
MEGLHKIVHALATCFLALYLAHLLTDFVFQSDRLVARKRGGALLAYAEHGGIHFVAAVVLSGVAVPGLLRSAGFYGLIVGLTLVHLGIDWVKLQFVRSHAIADGAASFFGDQIIHGLTVCITAWLIVHPPVLSIIRKIYRLQSGIERPLLLLVIYVGVIFAGGYVVRFLTKSLVKNDLRIGGETTNELQNAGMYIGWLERFLVLTALMLQSPATVGLILTAKSIARYPELKSIRFAEYFLIGTLLSVSLGIMGGLVLLKVFYGTVALSR